MMKEDGEGLFTPECLAYCSELNLSFIGIHRVYGDCVACNQQLKHDVDTELCKSRPGD